MKKLPYGTIDRVTFNEERHEYTFDGKKLNGVTTIIARKLGKSFPKTTTVALACSYGSQIHKESELWIERGREPCTENGKWVVEQLAEFRNKSAPKDGKFNAEVRVSDFENTASNVDVVLHTVEGVFLFDIKTGAFDRTYCTMQLNAYRLMYENSYNEKVLGMAVLCSKSRRLFKIFACKDEDALKLLSENK